MSPSSQDFVGRNLSDLCSGIHTQGDINLSVIITHFMVTKVTISGIIVIIIFCSAVDPFMIIRKPSNVPPPPPPHPPSVYRFLQLVKLEGLPPLNFKEIIIIQEHINFHFQLFWERKYSVSYNYWVDGGRGTFIYEFLKINSDTVKYHRLINMPRLGIHPPITQYTKTEQILYIGAIKTNTD